MPRMSQGRSTSRAGLWRCNPKMFQLLGRAARIVSDCAATEKYWRLHPTEASGAGIMRAAEGKEITGFRQGERP